MLNSLTQQKNQPTKLADTFQYILWCSKSVAPRPPPTIGLLNQATVGVDACPTLVGFLLSKPQDVLQAVQRHLNNLGVHDSQQVTERLDTTQIDQVSEERAPTAYTCHLGSSKHHLYSERARGMSLKYKKLPYNVFLVFCQG